MLKVYFFLFPIVILSISCSEIDPSLDQNKRMAQQRAACYFPAGSLPAMTIEPSRFPKNSILLQGQENTAIPVKKIVLLMQENRSFDSYLSQINQYKKNNRNDWSQEMMADVADDSVQNPYELLKNNSAMASRRLAHFACISELPHDWWAMHLLWNDKKMNGFCYAAHNYQESGQPILKPGQFYDIASSKWIQMPSDLINILKKDYPMDASGYPNLLDGSRALLYYDSQLLPFYYELASVFPVADAYFSSVLGPTFVNRDFFYAATSAGITNNSLTENTYSRLKQVGVDKTTILELLEQYKISSKIYVSSVSAPEHISRIATVYGIDDIKKSLFSGVDMSVFYSDANNGTLPSVSFIDADFAESAFGQDEHTPANVQLGQHFVWNIVRALMNGPDWPSIALFIVYDEAGGFYDHVVPPTACTPDNFPLLVGTNGSFPAFDLASVIRYPDNFNQLGMRVPAYVISPYSKPGGYVSHVVYDHTSVLRFIELKWNLPALTKRDAAADPMLDMFDFTQPAFLNFSTAYFKPTSGAIPDLYAWLNGQSYNNNTPPPTPKAGSHVGELISSGFIGAPGVLFKEPVIDFTQLKYCQQVFGAPNAPNLIPDITAPGFPTYANDSTPPAFPGIL